MILVTLGTQKEPFPRLLDCIEKSKIKDKIIVQAGHTKYESKKMEIFDFITYDEMVKLINDSDLVITHGGTGSILMPLKMGKKVIAFPRFARYHEHVDDHQTQIVDIFVDEGYILSCSDTDNFEEVYKKSQKFKPKKYISNTERFIKNIKKEIDN